MRARAVRLRAGRVVRLCSVRLHRAAFARQRRRHHGGAPARASCWRCACLRFVRLSLPCPRCVYLLCVRLLCVLSFCALALPMLALRALAVRVLVVRVRAGRLRAGCGVLVQHSLTSCGARRRHRHHIPRRPYPLRSSVETVAEGQSDHHITDHSRHVFGTLSQDRDDHDTGCGRMPSTAFSRPPQQSETL